MSGTSTNTGVALGGAAGSVGWDDDPVVTAWPGLAALPGNRTADACVIGLGGSGLAAVGALLERGLSVLGVDAGRVAAGAAGRNGGFLLGGAAAYLHTAVAQWGEAAAVQVYRATLAELRGLAHALGGDVVRRVGAIRLAGLPGEPRTGAEAEDRVRELGDCAEHAGALRAHGFAVEEYDGPLGQGLYLPEDAAMNPARRALALAAALAPRAALHEQTAVARVEPGRVTTERGVISASVVIVAVDGRLEVLTSACDARPLANAASAGDVESCVPSTVACARAPVSMTQRCAISEPSSRLPASAQPRVSTSASRAPFSTSEGTSLSRVLITKAASC